MKENLFYLESEILNALSHPNRIKIVEALRDGPRCACELLPLLGMEQSNLSRHIKILFQAGILNNWKEAQKIMYEVADKRYFQILDTLKEILKDKAIERIKILEE